MLLSEKKAQEMYDRILSLDVEAEIKKSKVKWINSSNSLSWLTDGNGGCFYQSFDTTLQQYRKESLNRKSVLIKLQNDAPYDGDKKQAIEVRVFPALEQNISADIDDIYARGIDTARAVNELLRLSSPNSSANIASSLDAEPAGLKTLKSYLKHFHSQLRCIESQDFSSSTKALVRFNGVCASLLVEQNVASDFKSASRAINFVRDFLWKRDLSKSHCVINKFGNYTILRYASPIEFDNNHRILNMTRPDVWRKQSAWREKLAKDMGFSSIVKSDWLGNFFEQHQKDLMRLSSTSMSRYTPNPANSFDCSDVFIENGCVKHIAHHLRTAITEPLNVGKTTSAQSITHHNHLQLLSLERLEKELKHFMASWGEVYQTGAIPFTILHQTLVGDEVAFTPDQHKAYTPELYPSVIYSKSASNAKIKAFLSDYRIYRDPVSGGLKVLHKSQQEASGKLQKVQLTLLETNNCINMWHSLARVRNNDYLDARKLIVTASQHIKASFESENINTGDLKTILNFIDSSNHSFFTPYKFRGRKVKEALENLTKKLRENNGDYSDWSASRRHKTALMLHAAVELKCVVHETWMGAARRKISNFTRDYFRKIPVLGHLADWAIRGTLTMLTYLVKPITLVFLALPQLIQHRNDRKAIYKATYEGLLAESLGILVGGCMSSLDRGPEMAEQRVSFRRYFIDHGKLVSYNDKPSVKKEFLKNYSQTKAKHVFNEMASGTAGTCDKETQGILVDVNLMSTHGETKEEKQLAKTLSVLRKGKYEQGLTTEAYLAESKKRTSASKTSKDRVQTSFSSVKHEDDIASSPKENTAKPQFNF